MEWIKDRNPHSPGLYGVRVNITRDTAVFEFAYFDGKGWIRPSEVNQEYFTYRGQPEWSVIDWGKD